MCGIAGFLELERRSGTQELEAIADAMAATLAHRGPDARGVFVDAEAGIALGHTRLSIIDLSPAGAQPMVSANGRYVIAYNGEIYSANEIRPELEALGHRFRGHSDTEVMVEAIAEWGVASDGRPSHRHVRLCPVGQEREALEPGARPARHQAALLGTAERPRSVRFGA